MQQPPSRLVSEALLTLLPQHACGLYLNHNAHKDIYEIAEHWVADNDWCDWKDEDAKARAIATDSIWTLQWYPETPIGFRAIAAPTLEELLAMIMEE